MDSKPRGSYEFDGKTHPKFTAEIWHEVGADGEPAFENGWSNVGGEYATAAFRLDAQEKVCYKGRVHGGEAGTTMFTLPVAYRANKTQFFSVAMAAAFGQLSIGSDGTVKLMV